jgi:hypothetical protein
MGENNCRRMIRASRRWISMERSGPTTLMPLLPIRMRCCKSATHHKVVLFSLGIIN